jgi:amino acid transporter
MNAQNSPKQPSKARFGGFLERAFGSFGGATRGGAGLLREHAVTIVTVTAIVGAALLMVAELLDLYHVVSPDGQLVAGTKATQTGGEHHSYALLVIGLAALAATLGARWAAQPMLAAAVGALGLIALLIVLIGDLPDVTSSGLTNGPLEEAEANPAIGFWLELVGALVVLVSGLALARLLTLTARRSPGT